jgi:hypothetical protein
VALLPGRPGEPAVLPWSIDNPRRDQMPVILWLLGVPLFVVILLMLFHVI